MRVVGNHRGQYYRGALVHMVVRPRLRVNPRNLVCPRPAWLNLPPRCGTCQGSGLVLRCGGLGITVLFILCLLLPYRITLWHSAPPGMAVGCCELRLRSTPRYRLVCICFPTTGRGLPYGSGLGLSRCLGPGECLHSFIHIYMVLLKKLHIEKGTCMPQSPWTLWQPACSPSCLTSSA